MRINPAKITAAAVAARTGYEYYKGAREWYQSRYRETIQIDIGTYATERFFGWLVENADIRSSQGHWYRDQFLFVANPLSDTEFVYNGNKYICTQSKGEQGADADGYATVRKYVTITCPNRQARMELEELISSLVASNRTEREPRAYFFAGALGGWTSVSFSQRPLETVILKEGQKEGIVNDLERFISSKDRYVRNGLPYHRGYLFYGAPGLGKTSLAGALSSHFKRDLYSLSLGAIDSDKRLVESFNSINDNSFVLLEDIDVFSATNRSGKSSDTGLTLAGLLNALDGVTTPPGLIYIMTTNDISSLDPALVRPGRCDYKLEFTPPNAAQVEAFFLNAFNEPLGVIPAEFNSMAELSEVVKVVDFDPQRAREIIEIGPKALDTL